MIESRAKTPTRIAFA